MTHKKLFEGELAVMEDVLNEARKQLLMKILVLSP